VSAVSPVHLYCFPYAGATSAIYRPWRAVGQAGLRVVGVDLPGRGARRAEQRVTDYRALVAALADSVVTDLRQASDRPRYATFGHSFGALVSLAVADAVARAVGYPPLRSVLSASLPPRLHSTEDEVAALGDAELLDKVRDDGGTAPELLANEAMAGYLIRLMREDHAVRAQFSRDRTLLVPFPLTTVAARDDRYVTPRQMRLWAEHTTAPVDQVEITGGHFAAFRDPAATLVLVHAELCPPADATGADPGDPLATRR
jgi:surfactin synthase thioesterase subunit